MYNRIKNTLAIASLATAFAAASHADTFGHTVNSGQSFSTSVYVSGPGLCTQYCGHYSDYGQSISSGPIGYFAVTNGSQSQYNVPISGSRSYSIFLSVTGSGYAGVQMSW